MRERSVHHVPPQTYAPVTKAKAVVKSLPKKSPRRTYDTSPLPIKLLDDVSRAVKIEARRLDLRGVWYTIRAGEKIIDEISMDEILNHVSPRHLEEYETKCFEEERELNRIVEAEDRRIAREEAAIAKKQRAKRKGRVIIEEIDDDDDDDDSSPEPKTELEGGRPRPMYKSMFMKVQKRGRRRKRDPRTGVLMSLSEHGSDEDEVMRAPQVSMSSSARHALDASGLDDLDDPPERRRRKREPRTGALLPLSPKPKERSSIASAWIAKGQRSQRQTTESFLETLPYKRPRRRRHPQTGELMPLGWKWEDETTEMTAAQYPSEGGISPSMNRLTLSQYQEPKRRKIASSNSSSQDVDIELFARSTKDRRDEVSISVSDESDEHDSEDAATTADQLAIAARAHAGPSAMQMYANYAAQRHSQPTNVVKSPLPNSMTSALHPTTREQDPSSEDNSGHYDELDEDEFFIEAILAHHLSDPLTHDSDYGTEPVMLYKVSWLGDVAPKTTWEPIESFPDLSIVYDYHRRAGLPTTNI